MKCAWSGIGHGPNGSANTFQYLTSTTVPTWSTNEAQKVIPLSDDIVVTRLVVDVGVAPGSGKSWTFTIRDDSANTAATVTISNLATSASWTGSASIAQLSKVCMASVPTSAPTAPGTVTWRIEYETTGNFYLVPAGNDGMAFASSGTLYNTPFGGNNFTPTGTITDVEVVIPTDLTVTKIAAYNGTNQPGGGNTNTYTVRKNNTTDSSFSAVLSGSTTSAVSSAGTLAFAPGDTLAIKEVKGPASNWTIVSTCMTIEPTHLGEIVHAFGNNSAPSTSATDYQPPLGQGLGGWNATESNAQIKLSAGTLKKLHVRLATATGAAKTRTFTVRKNGADTSIVATLTNTSTGSDTSNTATQADGDLVAIKHVPTSTPTGTNGVRVSFVLQMPTDVVGTLVATARAVTANLNGGVSTFGVMTATLRAPTANLNGSQTVSGTVVAQLRAVVAVLNGSQTIQGTVVATLRAVTAQLAGTAAASGTLAATLRALLAQLDGDTSTGELRGSLLPLTASLNGRQTVTGVLAAVMRAVLFTGAGGQLTPATLVAALQPLEAELVGGTIDGWSPPPDQPEVRFAFATPMPTYGIVSPTQIVTLRTAKGVQLIQWVQSDQTGLTWSMELRETSRCELAVINDGIRPQDIVPWLHWIDVFDDRGEQLLWTGPVTSRSIGHEQVNVSARDVSSLAARTRTRLTKRWDATDPAVIAGEHYAELIDHHGLNTRALVRNDPLGDRFDFASKADETQTDAVMSQLVDRGLYWTVVRGVPILGPWDRNPVASLGEDDFIGNGMTLTCDGTTTYNDILLRGADNYGRAIVPMGGLALQQTVSVDDMFGVSNVDKAVRQYARYAGSMRDAISLPQGSVLHPDAPITIDQLIPSARVTVTAFDMTFLMEVQRVEVSSGNGNSGSQVSVTLNAVDDELPELVELQQQGARR